MFNAYSKAGLKNLLYFQDKKIVMTDKKILAQKVTDRMMEVDYFSQWMGVKILAVDEGYSKIQMTLRKEMLNGFGIAHGGITFALADSAFAFACNSDGKITVALDVSISFPKAGKEGDILIAEAKQQSRVVPFARSCTT